MYNFFYTLLFMTCIQTVMAEKMTLLLPDSTSCNYEKKLGMFDGEYKSYYKNGKLKSEGAFLQNNRVGFWVFYKEDGRIQCLRDYINNDHYQEKLTDKKAISIVWNENHFWTPLFEKELLHKVRFMNTVLLENNHLIFSSKNMLEKIALIAQNNPSCIFSDERLVIPTTIDFSQINDISGFKIKEDYMIDRKTQHLHHRIIAIAPLVYSTKTKELNALCWIYYPSIKNELAKIANPNTSYPMLGQTLLDVFEYARYAVQHQELIKSNWSTQLKEDNIPIENLEIYLIEAENDLIANPISIN
jgi:hypothetical protein